MTLVQSLASSLASPLVSGLITSEDVSLFISIWKTDNAGVSASNQITIPVESSGVYNCEVDWGDGTADIITTWNDPSWTHTYSSAGTYTVKISGIFKGFRFNFGGDKLKLLDVSNCGILNVGNSGNYFHGCSNLIWTATDPLDLTGTFKCAAFFAGCSNFNSAIGNWDVSSVTDMQNMLRATAFNQPLNNWDVSNVTSMSRLFLFTVPFNQPLNNWDVSSVRNMADMFRRTSFNQPLNNWDVSSVTNMTDMFRENSSFDQDISNWDVSNVTNMTGMFSLGAGLSTVNYDQLLIGWEQLTLQDGVPFSGGESQYSAGTAATARASIISTYSWTITDGGQV
ncbi:MAG: DUF285 domain-containing protein [Candidatus Lokiarchaeota archaeon]|nr:DUF285 domain-containing protein [Candidatus Lokiarchaeota archaeon]